MNREEGTARPALGGQIVGVGVWTACPSARTGLGAPPPYIPLELPQEGEERGQEEAQGPRDSWPVRPQEGYP